MQYVEMDSSVKLSCSYLFTASVGLCVCVDIVFVGYVYRCVYPNVSISLCNRASLLPSINKYKPPTISALLHSLLALCSADINYFYIIFYFILFFILYFINLKLNFHLLLKLILY